jgi:predicted DNA-binding protein (MmcQ/YjbR family)
VLGPRYGAGTGAGQRHGGEGVAGPRDHHPEPEPAELRAAAHLNITLECRANCLLPALFLPRYCDPMTWEDVLAYCLVKPGAWQDEPWEGDVVAKVGSKIFAFLGSGATPSVGLKCGTSREDADEWLLRYPDDARVMAYIGRSGWNTLLIGGAIPDDEVTEAIDGSYATVVSKLPKKDRP